MNTSKTLSRSIPQARRVAWIAATLALLLAGGCATQVTPAPGPGAQATGLNAQGVRISDERILSDRKTLEAVQRRLKALSDAGVAQSNYSLAKAQCWLDTAKSQYHENDRTGYVEESLAQSMKIIGQLEADKGARAGWDTPLVANSTKLREDLWARMGQMKMADTLSCTAQALACAEVRLVRAGHAEQQTGWRAATPHVGMVEDALVRAQGQAQACQLEQQQQAALRARAAPPPPAPAPVVVAAVPVPAPAPQIINRESFILLTDTLFGFDKSGKTDMLAAGLQRLDAVVSRLKGYQSIHTLTITGHTDRLGSDEYNDKLSTERATTVRDYLVGLGLKASSVKVHGRGKREPGASNCPNSMSRPELIACLQPDRRGTIEVTGTVR